MSETDDVKRYWLLPGIGNWHPVVLRNVHGENDCVGHACCLHRPSETRVKDWPVYWDDRGPGPKMYRICPEHHLLTSDPDDIDFYRMNNLYQLERFLNDIGLSWCPSCFHTYQDVFLD